MNDQTNPKAAEVFRKRQRRAAQAQVTDEEQAMHEHSRSRYPELSLSPGEFVLQVVRRHPIGLIYIWAIVGVLVLAMLAIVPFYAVNMTFIAQMLLTKPESLISPAVLAVPDLVLVAFFLLGGLIATWVYNNNRFYLTTESIIQFVQYSLFNSKQQVVNLINVEDVSADQRGIMQQVLNYGTLRVSTQGQETIYHFRWVANPNSVVHDVNDATEIAIQKLEGTNFPVTELAA